MSILHKLQWRYATKKFDNQKTVPEDDITELLKAMNLSASSFGLQPYEFIVIHDKELQKKLQQVSYNQAQIIDASHIIVIAAKTEITKEYIEEYVQHIVEVRETDVESLEDYKQSMLQSIGSKPSSDQLAWTQRQCYLPLGTLLVAGADLKIDVCPMEGFISEEYDRILGLKEKGLHTTVIAAVGYRSHEDNYQYAKKVRKELNDIVQLFYK